MGQQETGTYWRVVLINGQIIQGETLQVSDGGTQVWMKDNVVIIPIKVGIPVLKVEQCVLPFSSVLYMSEIMDKPEEQ